jgi:hypothetical protein
MRRSIDFYRPATDEVLRSADDDELAPLSWVVAVSDDYDDEGIRVVLTVEEVGRAGYGLTAHLDPDQARRLRLALRNALREVGELGGE